MKTGRAKVMKATEKVAEKRVPDRVAEKRGLAMLALEVMKNTDEGHKLLGELPAFIELVDSLPGIVAAAGNKQSLQALVTGSKYYRDKFYNDKSDTSGLELVLGLARQGKWDMVEIILDACPDKVPWFLNVEMCCSPTMKELAESLLSIACSADDTVGMDMLFNKYPRPLLESNAVSLEGVRGDSFVWVYAGKRATEYTLSKYFDAE